MCAPAYAFMGSASGPFLAIDFENLDKLEMFREDPVLLKFAKDVIQPNTSDCLECVYEMEPGKDVKYS